jgi:hypothetical protein
MKVGQAVTFGKNVRRRIGGSETKMLSRVFGPKGEEKMSLRGTSQLQSSINAFRLIKSKSKSLQHTVATWETKNALKILADICGVTSGF